MGALDGATTLIVALGAGVAGGLAGLVPGLHANTLATVVLVSTLSGWLPSPWAPALLMGLLGAWTFANTVPLIVLGVPEGEDAPALMPGQRMARQGATGQAVRSSAKGSLVGLVAGSALALAIAWAYGRFPLYRWLPAATPVVQGVALVVLVVTDSAGPVRSSTAALLAGTLGAGALSLPVRSPIGLPATPLAPLFIGLFGLPALRRASRAGPPDPRPGPSRNRHRDPSIRAGLLGAGLGTLAGTVSGFTAGPATAIAAQLRPARDADVLATTSAVNTTIACVATGLLHAAQRTRTGVHAARLALSRPADGLGALAGDLTSLAAGALPGLVVLAMAARRGDEIASALPRLAPLLLAGWVALVGAQTGVAGFAILAAGWTTARACHALGARRSLLMACLLVPGLLDALPALG